MVHLRAMTFAGILSYTFFSLLVPAVFVISMVAFLWGAFLYVIAGNQDEEMQEKGKAVMLYGLLVFVCMVVLYAILRFVMGILF